MQVKWQTLITKVVVWILLESLLNLLGLDQLANYSEFLSHARSTSLASARVLTSAT